MVAYDYENQQWVGGEPARLLLVSQISDEIRLLRSDEGEAYARMIGADRIEILAAREAFMAIMATVVGVVVLEG